MCADAVELLPASPEADVPYRRTLLGSAGVKARDASSKLETVTREQEQRLLCKLAKDTVMKHLPTVRTTATTTYYRYYYYYYLHLTHSVGAGHGRWEPGWFLGGVSQTVPGCVNNDQWPRLSSNKV